MILWRAVLYGSRREPRHRGKSTKTIRSAGANSRKSPEDAEGNRNSDQDGFSLCPLFPPGYTLGTTAGQVPVRFGDNFGTVWVHLGYTLGTLQVHLWDTCFGVKTAFSVVVASGFRDDLSLSNLRIGKMRARREWLEKGSGVTRRTLGRCMTILYSLLLDTSTL